MPCLSVGTLLMARVRTPNSSYGGAHGCPACLLGLYTDGKSEGCKEANRDGVL